MKKVIKTMKGGKITTKSKKRIPTASEKYTSSIDKKTKKKANLDASIQKKKSFFGRFKNLITFKKAKSYELGKNINATSKKLETVEEARQSTEKTSKVNETTQKEAETSESMNKEQQIKNALLPALRLLKPILKE